MTKTSFIFLVPLLAPWVSLCAIHQQPAKLPLQQRHYLLAKQLIEDNCVDCMGGTKAGMENGIQEMQAALATGFADDKAAYKLLADAYNAMTTYVGNDEKERDAFQQKESQALAEVYRLDPLDSEFAIRYATTLKDDQQKLTIFKNVVARDSRQADAAFNAGLLLIDGGKHDEGTQFISKAIANQKDPEAVVNCAQRTLEALQNHNCPMPDAEEWSQKFSQAADSATRGAGDPRPMLEVKKQFLIQLEKHRCKTHR